MSTPIAKIAVEPAAKYTAEEAAKRLGIGVRQLREGIDRGELPGHRVGGTYHIYRDAVERFVAGEPGDWSPRLIERTAEEIASRLAGDLPDSPFLHRIERLREAV